MSGVEVNSVIDKLADKLAVPVGELMKLMPALGVKAFASLITSIVVLIICVSVGVFAIPSIHRAWYEGDNPLVAVGGVFFVGMLVVFSICALMGIVSDASSVTLWLYNPQAWALDYVLQMIR